MMDRFERPTNKLEVYHSIQLSYIIDVPVKASIGCLNQTFIFGGSGVRTHDLHLAKMPLYQLSYTPFYTKIKLYK